jgi:hypothetical protein
MVVSCSLVAIGKTIGMTIGPVVRTSTRKARFDSA